MLSKELVDWTTREVTKPQQMEASLRYATLVPCQDFSSGHFAFPYHKKINGESYCFYLRKNCWYPHEPKEADSFCLDIGRFTNELFAGRKVFQSSGWIDFYVGNSFLAGRHFKKDRRIGRVYMSKNVVDWCNYVRRPADEYKNWGIFVAEKLRRQGVATSLISASRVILNQLEVPVLVLEGIEYLIATGEWGNDTREYIKTPKQRFYEKTNGHIFDRNVSPIFGLTTTSYYECSSVSFPTKATSFRPYIFA